jgi:hypothetical protein
MEGCEDALAYGINILAVAGARILAGSGGV